MLCHAFSSFDHGLSAVQSWEEEGNAGRCLQNGMCSELVELCWNTAWGWHCWQSVNAAHAKVVEKNSTDTTVPIELIGARLKRAKTMQDVLNCAMHVPMHPV